MTTLVRVMPRTYVPQVSVTHAFVRRAMTTDRAFRCADDVATVVDAATLTYIARHITRLDAALDQRLEANSFVSTPRRDTCATMAGRRSRRCGHRLTVETSLIITRCRTHRSVGMQAHKMTSM
jgi:hypothetical protein